MARKRVIDNHSNKFPAQSEDQASPTNLITFCSLLLKIQFDNCLVKKYCFYHHNK